jgi:hypothetical protein
MQFFDDRFQAESRWNPDSVLKRSSVHSALVSFKQVFDDRFQEESGWNPDSAWKRSSKPA